MPTKTRQPNNNGINNYLAIKRMRAEATFRITCEGECYYIVNGHHLMEDEFNSMYPVELIRTNVKGNTIGHKQQVC